MTTLVCGCDTFIDHHTGIAINRLHTVQVQGKVDNSYLLLLSLALIDAIM